MDTPKSPKPAHLLDDLEAIRELLEKDQLEPPLLTDTLDDSLQIPLLSDIIEPGPAVPQPLPMAAFVTPAAVPAPRPTVSIPPQPVPPPPVTPAPAPVAPATSKPAPSVTATVIGTAVQRSLAPSATEQNRLDAELRAAAQLILQDVIDDFVPQIEAELKRRLDARLDRLIKRPKP